MNILSRIPGVALAYLAASAVGASGIWLAISFGFGPDALSGPSESVMPQSATAAVLKAVHLSLRTGLFVAPAALPIILYAEWKTIGSGLYFGAAGLVLGLVVAGLLFFAVLRASVDEAPLLALIAVATPLTAAMTYWAVAWKWLAPPPRIEAAQ